MRIGIVTGASSGLGRSFVRHIDKTMDLDELWLIARREERLRGPGGGASVQGAGLSPGPDGPGQRREAPGGPGGGAAPGGHPGMRRRLRQVRKGGGHDPGGERRHDRPQLPRGGWT